MSEATQSRRRILTSVALLIVLVGAFIILRPRLWVKNKTAKVIVDGRLSEHVKLFHGSDGRLLFYLLNEPRSAYVYLPERGLWHCSNDEFISLKIIGLSKWQSSGCAGGDAHVVFDVAVGDQKVSFNELGHDITVSWQAAPR